MITFFIQEDRLSINVNSGLFGGSDGKESACDAGDIQYRWVQSLGRVDLLENERATYPSILGWEIPWTEETGGLQFMGSQSQT